MTGEEINMIIFKERTCILFVLFKTREKLGEGHNILLT